MTAKHGGDVSVWFAAETNRSATIHAPDGWQFKKAFLATTGEACVRFEEVTD